MKNLAWRAKAVVCPINYFTTAHIASRKSLIASSASCQMRIFIACPTPARWHGTTSWDSDLSTINSSSTDSSSVKGDLAGLKSHPLKSMALKDQPWLQCSSSTKADGSFCTRWWCHARRAHLTPLKRTGCVSVALRKRRIQQARSCLLNWAMTAVPPCVSEISKPMIIWSWFNGKESVYLWCCKDLLWTDPRLCRRIQTLKPRIESAGPVWISTHTRRPLGHCQTKASPNLILFFDDGKTPKPGRQGRTWESPSHFQK